MRISIVFWHFFYCSVAYSEGGRVKFSDFFAYVIKVWPLRQNNSYAIDSIVSCLKKHLKEHTLMVENVAGS